MKTWLQFASAVGFIHLMDKLDTDAVFWMCTALTAYGASALALTMYTMWRLCRSDFVPPQPTIAREVN